MSLKIGILNTGKMGSSLARAAKDNGHKVFWASEGRSIESKNRAHELGLDDVLTVKNIFSICDVVVSICMGSGVMPNAIAASAGGFKGIYVDANHVGDVSHENHLKNIIEDAGISYVDASIYGWPYPHEQNPDSERTLYLSGGKANDVKSIFHGYIFDCKVTEMSAKEVKRQREVADRADCAPHIDHGYGIVEFPRIMQIEDIFIDSYMQRREISEPQDYYVDEEGFYVNRGGYRFTKEHVDKAPRRYLNLTPDGCPQEDIDFHAKIEAEISKCINAYRGIYPEVYDCVRWRTDAHIAAYPAGAGMGMHHDNAIGSAGKSENPIFNVLSLSLILSDRCEGGELEMKYVNKAFKPQKGTVIIYPASFLGSHAVSKVESGLRISYLEFFGHGTVSGQTKPI
jgi:hypothetical protein